VAGPGFDPWTGQPHGRIYTAYDCLKVPADPHAVVTTVKVDVPDEFAGRQAIPLPIGFVIGGIITLSGLALVRRRGASKPELSLSN
jgi:hypothetical protein